MKKITNLILLILFISLLGNAQSNNQLIRLHNMVDNTAMNAIPSPFQGNLVYVNSSNDLYYFDGLSWKLLGGQGSSSGDLNDDAWGVTGEDLISDISRTGKVTIGATGSTDTKLDVNGQVIFNGLPNRLGILRPVLHAFNGQLRSDKYTSYLHDIGFIPPGGWINLNHVKNGVTVTGYYLFSNTCAKGHFEFRYQSGQPTLYVLEYNDGNGIFSYNSSTTNYEIKAGFCSAIAYFRVFNNMLQVQGPIISAGFVDLDIRVEAY